MKLLTSLPPRLPWRSSATPSPATQPPRATSKPHRSLPRVASSGPRVADRHLWPGRSFGSSDKIGLFTRQRLGRWRRAELLLPSQHRPSAWMPPGSVRRKGTLGNTSGGGDRTGDPQFQWAASFSDCRSTACASRPYAYVGGGYHVDGNGLGQRSAPVLASNIAVCRTKSASSSDGRWTYRGDPLRREHQLQLLDRARRCAPRVLRKDYQRPVGVAGFATAAQAFFCRPGFESGALRSFASLAALRRSYSSFTGRRSHAPGRSTPASRPPSRIRPSLRFGSHRHPPAPWAHRARRPRVQRRVGKFRIVGQPHRRRVPLRRTYEHPARPPPFVIELHYHNRLTRRGDRAAAGERSQYK